jgi:hypothetical protein
MDMMHEFYIGNFSNPNEDDESWEEYVRRKQREEEGKMSSL